MKPKLKLGVVGCLCLSFVGAFAQVSRSGAGYLFRYQYEKGKSYKYAMESVAKNPSIKMNVGLKFKVTVLKVGKNTSKLKYDIDSMTQNGKPIGRSQTAEVDIDRRGNVIGDSGTIQQLGNVAYPKEAIAIGKSWTRNVNSAAMGFKMNLKGTYKFSGFKTLRGKRYAVLDVKMKNTGDFSVDGGGTMLVDAADGMVYNYQMTMTVSMKTSQQSVKLDNIVNIKRL